MGNEMGNNNTSGLRDEEDTTVEVSEKWSIETTHANDIQEENEKEPAGEGKDFHENVTNLASDDLERIKDPCVDRREPAEAAEVHALAESLDVTMKSKEAGEEDSSKMQAATLLNESGHEKPIEENMEETDDLQRTIKHQLEKQASFKKEEENGARVEACESFSIETTHANDIIEENETVPAAEGKVVHEKFTNLASDDPERVEDPCVDYQTSNQTEQEDTKVHALAESLDVTLESHEVCEGDSKMEPTLLLNDSGNEKPIEQKIEEIDQQRTIKCQLEKQVSFKKEEEGTISTPHDPEPTESINFELNQHELATVQADQSVEDGSESLQGSDLSEDCVGSSSTSAVEVNSHISDTEVLKNTGESVDSNTDPVTEKERDDLLLEKHAPTEQVESSKEKFESNDGEVFDSSLSTITTIASNGLSSLGNKWDEEVSTEMNLIGNDCSVSEPEAIPVTNSPNSHLEVPEPEDKCTILKEEIRLIENEPENGENKHDDNSFQSCGESVIKSESFNSSNPQFEAAMVGSIHENSEKVGAFNPLSDKDCQTEETKVVENGGLVVMCVSNQNEGSEDFCLASEGRVKVDRGLIGTVPAELDIPNCIHKEEESTEKEPVQENGDITEPLYAIEIGGTEVAEKCLSLQLLVDQAEALPLQNVFGSNNVQSTNESNDSTLNLKQESCGEFLATEACAVVCTNWIGEALASMNKLALLDIPGQQFAQHSESPQAASNTKISANQFSEASEKVETSESVSCDSETQESVGRSSTESENLNVRARIQKSPSFSLDLQNAARTEESDCSPSLYHDKAAIEGSPSQGDDVSLGNLIAYTRYEGDVSQCQAMPVEEKVIPLERIDTEESKTPFIGFLKEEEEAHMVVTPHEHDKHSPTKTSTKNLLDSNGKEATRTSSKGKEKRRNRSSLFTNCMCCATVIN